MKSHDCTHRCNFLFSTLLIFFFLSTNIIVYCPPRVRLRSADTSRAPPPKIRRARQIEFSRPSPFNSSRNVETPSSLTRRRRSVLPLSASVAPARNGYQDVDLSSPSPSPPTPANEKTDFSRRGHRPIASRSVRSNVGPGVAHRPQREDIEKSRQQGTLRASNARRYTHKITLVDH